VVPNLRVLSQMPYTFTTASVYVYIVRFSRARRVGLVMMNGEHCLPASDLIKY